MTAITIGEAGAGTANPVGTITVTDTKQGTGNIIVDGGTAVTTTATVTMADNTAIANGGDITIGGNKAASGAVVVTQNLNSDGGDADGDDLAAANIAITGGKTVDVTVNATVTAKDKNAQGDITIGTVAVEGDGNTTSVKVTQNASSTKFTTAAVAEVVATQAVTFKDLDEGESVTVNGLTFVASKDLLAADVAKAFANLSSSDKQEDGGPVVNGYYTGAFATVAGWTSGAASGATVTFTAPAHNSVALVISDTAVLAPVAAAIVAGTVGSGVANTTNDITKGKVTVYDYGTTDAITTVTLDGFNAADIGAAGSASGMLNALTTLNLANNTTDDTIGVGTTATTLTLNVNNIQSSGTTFINLDSDGDAVTDQGSETVETLTINATGAASSFELFAGALKNLTVNASVGLNISDTAASYATADLETVDVNGAGAVNLGDMTDSVALNTFDASGNTGGVTATVETDAGTLTGDVEEFIFSEGADTVTLVATTGSAVDVKVSTGAGNDKVTLSTGITTAGAVIDGGTGSNTLHMDAANAVTASATNTFEGKISNFQKLSLGNATTAGTVDLANMDDISYVISANSGAGAATKEVFKADFNTSGTIIGADTIAFNGSGAIVLTAGWTAAQIATAVAGGTFTNWDAVDGTDGTVTFTAKNAGLTGDVLAGDFTIVDTDLTTAAVAVTTGTQGTYTYTFDTTGLNLNAPLAVGDTFVIGDYTYTTAADGDDVNDIALDIENGGLGTTISGVLYNATVSGADLILTTTATTAPGSLTYTATDVDNDGGTFNAGIDSAAAQSRANGVAEVFTADFTTSGAIEDGDTIVFDGVTITLSSGMTAAQIAAAVAGQAYTNYNATNLGNDEVQFTKKVGGAVTDVVAGGFTISNVEGTTTTAKVTVNVTTQGAAAGTAPTLTLDNMANDGTLELTTAGAGVNVIVTDADEVGQTSNILNVILSDSLTNSGINVGSVVVDDVETVDVTANDAVQDANGDGVDDTNAAHTVDVKADSVKTINVDGAGDVTLTTTSTVLTTVNAASLTGKLAYNALVAKTVVTANTGNDILTASANEVTINAGAGNDTITIADNVDKVVVDGGAGVDTFIIAGAASNKDSYAVFKNVASGDIFDFGTSLAGDVSDFLETKITLSEGATESTQAFLNQAVKDLAQHEMGWFNYGGNTFIVVDKSNSATAFEDGTDVVVMITGTVNLSTGATFNSTSDLLEII